MSLKNKLNRLKSHMGLDPKEPSLPNVPEDTVLRNEVEEEVNARHIPFFEKWSGNHTAIYEKDREFCFIREVNYPLDYKHGIYKLGDAAEAVRAWNQASHSHPLSAKGMDITDMFFFDTETTGLGGGAGNTIFMLGYAFFHENGVTVRQHILPHPGAEIPLYHSFLEKVDYNTLVTYNGKAFDWPQLKTRHTLIRDHVPKLPEYGHFDLYHGSRRLWKNELDRVKLSNVEKEILGIEREDDVPGYLAPIIYFDFIERKDPDGLFGIIRHNEWDVLTLITLYTHLSMLLLQKYGGERPSLEIARWYMGLGEKETAKNAYTRVLEGEDEGERAAALHALAFQWKREGKEREASDAWKTVCEQGTPKERREAYIELAKIYEHSKKEYHEALIMTEKAQAIETNNQSKGWQDLQKRLGRLKKKAGIGE
ncbi:ribonuclease H-like domain-containing protein [Peribacillus sp. SCS-37]|uniref:ribonuclease H-like domain-containing protein n=1 Tax=Paraperibacillus esterisolvens TaxID=3115296 RepID=UPI003906C735